MSPSTTKALVELLKSLFTTDELYRFAASLPHGNLTSVLPSAPASLDAVAFEMVQALERRGQIDGEFFARLEEERPGRMGEITRVRTLILDSQPKQPGIIDFTGERGRHSYQLDAFYLNERRIIGLVGSNGLERIPRLVPLSNDEKSTRLVQLARLSRALKEHLDKLEAPVPSFEMLLVRGELVVGQLFTAFRDFYCSLYVAECHRGLRFLHGQGSHLDRPDGLLRPVRPRRVTLAETSLLRHSLLMERTKRSA